MAKLLIYVKNYFKLSFKNSGEDVEKNVGIDKIIFQSVGHVFQQLVGKLIETQGAPLLPDPFNHSHDLYLIVNLYQKNKGIRPFCLSFHYKNDVLSLITLSGLRYIITYYWRSTNGETESNYRYTTDALDLNPQFFRGVRTVLLFLRFGVYCFSQCMLFMTFCMFSCPRIIDILFFVLVTVSLLLLKAYIVLSIIPILYVAHIYIMLF